MNRIQMDIIPPIFPLECEQIQLYVFILFLKEVMKYLFSEIPFRDNKKAPTQKYLCCQNGDEHYWKIHFNKTDRNRKKEIACVVL